MARRTPQSRCDVDPVPTVVELLTTRPELSYKAVGAQAGCSPGRVSQIAARHGLGRRQGQRVVPTPRVQLLRDLCAQLAARGLRQAEMLPILAEQLGRPVHRQEVSRAIKSLKTSA